MHDHLPPEVEALLARARSAQATPDAITRERVKQGVIAAIATGAIVSSAAHVSAHAGKAWFASSFAAKITGVTLLGAVAAGSVVAPSFVAKHVAPVFAPAQKSRRAQVPRLPELPSHDAPDLAAAPPPPSSGGPADGLDTAAAEGASRASAPSGSLAAELRLLDRASQALTRNDLTSARALLEQHRTGFARPVMVEEREGLELIVRCRLEPTAAQRDARDFLARAAHSVLSARVARACGRTR